MELKASGLIGDPPDHGGDGPLGWDPAAELFHSLNQGGQKLLLTLLPAKGSHAGVEILESGGMGAPRLAGGDDGQAEKGQVQRQQGAGEIEQSRFHTASPRYLSEMVNRRLVLPFSSAGLSRNPWGNASCPLRPSIQRRM